MNLLTKHIFRIHLIIAITAFTACSTDDPKKEDVPELITTVSLTFTPQTGGTAIKVTASDPDGEGVQPITVDGSINLSANTTYLLKIEMINALADPSTAAYNITNEVEKEGDEHMFFFSWTNNVFSNPDGDGNIDNRDDALNYIGGDNSKDVNNLPLGLTTTWTTATTSSGHLRVLLKHQPDLKTGTSDAKVGETDLDVTFQLNVAE